MAQDNGVLVHCEVSDGRLSGIAREVLGIGSILARDTGRELSAVLIGSDLKDAGREAIARGAHNAYVVDNSLLKEYQTDYYLHVLKEMVDLVHPEIILFGHTHIGKDLAPCLAFDLDTGASLDCVALAIDPQSKRLLMTKPVFGGNAHAVRICKTTPQLATVRMKTMSPLEKDDTREGEIVYPEIHLPEDAARQKKTGEERDASGGVKLEDAKVIVSGGRGIGSPDGFKELGELAEVLSGVVGASRPACDNKWISDRVQIGLTGKVVSPQLYIGVGISGSSQHMAGCAGSKRIVAINKDPDANIFKYAHYGIVEDWQKILPVIVSTLKNRS